MCEYCSLEDNKDLIQSKSNEEEIFLYVECNRIHLEVFDLFNGQSYGTITKINFCPICGRRLV